MTGIEKQLETIALELHDAGDHDSGGVLDRIATELAALREERDGLRDVLEQASEWANRIAGDERVCGWVHAEDYGLYCLLADCEIDFEAALGKEDAGANDARDTH